MNYISCVNINRDYYSQADYDIKCDSQFYKYKIFPTTLILIFLLAIILPFMITGILISGYRNNTF